MSVIYEPGERWLQIRAMPTEIHAEGRKIHESVLRSFHIVERLQEMLRRGDSSKTLLEFIGFATSIGGGVYRIPPSEPEDSL